MMADFVDIVGSHGLYRLRIVESDLIEDNHWKLVVVTCNWLLLCPLIEHQALSLYE